jgi:ADP-ribose pyrophosphatase YjhB (NUDIX family)
MVRNNFEFEHNGEKLWYSRSLACIGFVFRKSQNTYEVLISKRGNGCEYNKGKWNVPGGFIDFNEDAKDCVIREMREETGINISRDDLEFVFLDTKPNNTRQSMIVGYAAFFNVEDTVDWEFTTQYAEENEVSEIKWINVRDIEKYKWSYRQMGYFNQVLKHYNILNK